MAMERMIQAESGRYIQPFVDAEGTEYSIVTDGTSVGFQAVRDGQVEYIYLTPSSEDDEGRQSTVFLYQGPTGEPDMDEPVVFYNVLPPLA